MSLPRQSWSPSPKYPIGFLWECHSSFPILMHKSVPEGLGIVYRHVQRLRHCSPLYLRQGLFTSQGASQWAPRICLSHLLLHDRRVYRKQSMTNPHFFLYPYYILSSYLQHKQFSVWELYTFIQSIIAQTYAPFLLLQFLPHPSLHLSLLASRASSACAWVWSHLLEHG